MPTIVTNESDVEKVDERDQSVILVQGGAYRVIRSKAMRKDQSGTLQDLARKRGWAGNVIRHKVSAWRAVKIWWRKWLTR